MSSRHVPDLDWLRRQHSRRANLRQRLELIMTLLAEDVNSPMWDRRITDACNAQAEINDIDERLKAYADHCGGAIMTTTNINHERYGGKAANR